jgi:hypothetical protein
MPKRAKLQGDRIVTCIIQFIFCYLQPLSTASCIFKPADIRKPIAKKSDPLSPRTKLTSRHLHLTITKFPTQH